MRFRAPVESDRSTALRPDSGSKGHQTRAFTLDSFDKAAGFRDDLPISTVGADGVGRANVMASGTTENLERLSTFLDTGALRVKIQDTNPLEQAGSALESLTGTHTRGKLAITIAS